MEAAVGIVFVIFLGGLIFAWSLMRAAELRERWAEEHGYSIEAARYCWIWRGPFFLRSSENQMVFHIIVRDADGRRRSGWLRCGGFFSGLFGSQAKVIWEDE